MLTEIAPAKINLTLRVLGRRADGYHELESLVAFADVGDMLRLQTGTPLALEIDGPYAEACGAPADNLVLKAAAALSARVAGLRLGRFRLTKELPVASGIGGGSADAAAALRLLVHCNRQLFSGVDFADPRVQAAALAVGADVPVCLASKSCIMRGVGEQLSPVDLPAMAAVLVNPGVALGTRDVFAKFAGPQVGSPIGEAPRDPKAVAAFLAQHGNDLTPAAIACAPVIETVLAELRDLPGSLLAQMSGSGATCFVLFASAGEAAAAASLLQAERSGWWVRAGTIG